MRRSFLVACAVLALAGCDKSEVKPTDDPAAKGRSEAVRATGAQAATQAPTATHAAIAPKTPRKICDVAPAAAGRPLPTQKLDHREAPGAAPLADRLATSGKWTWVNLWAAWCGPCKEEIPRLKAWEQKLGGAMSVAFVSLDDDERQMTKFLESQPSSGLRTSYWLPEGKARSGFLAELKLKADPQLPLQLLVDPQGTLRCVIDGAVDDLDFAQVQALVAKR